MVLLLELCLHDLGQWQGTPAPPLARFACCTWTARCDWWVWDLSTCYVVQVLKACMEALGIPKEKYEGYLQLRMFGSVPHAGFGMDLERLVMFATGLENIREAIPFPRSPGHAE